VSWVVNQRSFKEHYEHASEEAGCTSAEILAHCRSGGEHVRNCWALDLILANE
jgi:hypothetical protein